MLSLHAWTGMPQHIIDRSRQGGVRQPIRAHPGDSAMTVTPRPILIELEESKDWFGRQLGRLVEALLIFKCYGDLSPWANSDWSDVHTMRCMRRASCDHLPFLVRLGQNGRVRLSNRVVYRPIRKCVAASFSTMASRRSDHNSITVRTRTTSRESLTSSSRPA
jgi:hypothetical protein